MNLIEPNFNVREYVNAWNTHDAERIAGFYADDAEIRALPNPEPYRGREGVRRNVRETLEGLGDVNGDVEWSIQQGSRVALLVHVSGKHSGPLRLTNEQVIPPTDKPVRFTLAMFAELDPSGKIKRETQIPDAVTLLQHTGVLEGMQGAMGGAKGGQPQKPGRTR